MKIKGVGGGGGRVRGRGRVDNRGRPDITKIVVLLRLQRDNKIRVVLVER